MNQNPNLHNQPVAQDLSIAVSEKEVKLEIKKNRIIRALYIIGGTISLALAILGIVLPGLPVTPLALLSAFLYAKSSPRLYNWLLNNKILGPRIRNYQRRKGITRRGKLGVIAFMSIMVLFSSFVIMGPGTIRWVILALGFIGCIVVVFFVPNAKGDEASERVGDEATMGD
ncbi:MAG: YbaN family protein [Proteiniphilum sp.]|uniref:YbaN family protein n=1 Tax=Proteiniphilum sp. TaxID=1926877 RepID=UPI00268E41FF|nr:YbaN family protein [Proteiniphilum sp.]MEA5129778.1 YbaN family protein [Proteiniphilum sp.]